jgi:uncharacterized protein involved in outer membrane biogenesis
MPKSPKFIFLAAGGLVGALILVAMIVLLILGVNAKRQVQTLLSDALEMEVNVGGRLDIGFFPSLHITMENVQIRNRGSEIASAAQASVGIELFPLLHKEVRMDIVGLKHVKISIERLRDGRFNFETRKELKRTFSPTDVAIVSLSDATLLYTDQQSGKALEADSCDLNVRHLQLSKNKSAVLLKSLSFTAVLACGEIRTKDLVLSEVKFSIDGTGGSSISTRSRCAPSADRGRVTSGQIFPAPCPSTMFTTPCRSSTSRSSSRPCRQGMWATD